MKCHCGGDLNKHEGGPKDGTFHCDACGCCMTPDGQPREGHPGCGETGITKPTPKSAAPEGAEAKADADEARARGRK